MYQSDYDRQIPAIYGVSEDEEKEYIDPWEVYCDMYEWDDD